MHVLIDRESMIFFINFMKTNKTFIYRPMKKYFDCDNELMASGCGETLKTIIPAEAAVQMAPIRQMYNSMCGSQGKDTFYFSFIC